MSKLGNVLYSRQCHALNGLWLVESMQIRRRKCRRCIDPSRVTTLWIVNQLCSLTTIALCRRIKRRSILIVLQEHSWLTTYLNVVEFYIARVRIQICAGLICLQATFSWFGCEWTFSVVCAITELTTVTDWNLSGSRKDDYDSYPGKKIAFKGTQGKVELNTSLVLIYLGVAPIWKKMPDQGQGQGQAQHNLRTSPHTHQWCDHRTHTVSKHSY